MFTFRFKFRFYLAHFTLESTVSAPSIACRSAPVYCSVIIAAYSVFCAPGQLELNYSYWAHSCIFRTTVLLGKNSCIFRFLSSAMTVAFSASWAMPEKHRPPINATALHRIIARSLLFFYLILRWSSRCPPRASPAGSIRRLPIVLSFLEYSKLFYLHFPIVLSSLQW